MMIKYRGANQRKCQEELFCEGEADALKPDRAKNTQRRFKVPGILENGGAVVSESYKHLGSFVNDDGKLVCEARHRASEGLHALAKIGNTLADRSIEPSLREMLANMMA
eukprot:4119465-Karenia_brevis.AAC.1